VVDFGSAAARRNQLTVPDGGAPPAPCPAPQLPVATEEQLAERRNLPGGDEDLTALCGGRLCPGRLLPLPQLADLARMREEIERELGPPATDDDVDAALDMLSHQKAEDGVDIRYLIEANIRVIGRANVPLAILWQGVYEAQEHRIRFPDPPWLLATFAELRQPYSDWLYRIRRCEEEQKRRQDEQEAKQQREMQDLFARFEALVDLEERLRRAGDDAPSPADIEDACTLQPVLWRGDNLLRWSEFADQDAPAAAALCRRLAQIMRGNLDWATRAKAVTTAVLEAGFDASAPASAAPALIHRQRPIEQDTAPRQLAHVMVARDGWRMVDDDNPEFQRLMHEMGAEAPGGQ
jgi:hypothetical protein